MDEQPVDIEQFIDNLGDALLEVMRRSASTCPQYHIGPCITAPTVWDQKFKRKVAEVSQMEPYPSCPYNVAERGIISRLIAFIDGRADAFDW